MVQKVGHSQSLEYDFIYFCSQACSFPPVAGCHRVVEDLLVFIKSSICFQPISTQGCCCVGETLISRACKFVSDGLHLALLATSIFVMYCCFYYLIKFKKLGLISCCSYRITIYYYNKSTIYYYNKTTNYYLKIRRNSLEQAHTYIHYFFLLFILFGLQLDMKYTTGIVVFIIFLACLKAQW